MQLADAPRQIRALDDSLAAIKLLPEASARTVGEARALDARRREQQSVQWTPSPAVPTVPRDQAASAAQREAARTEQQQRGGGRGGAAAAAAAERVTPVTLPKKRSVSGQIGQFWVWRADSRGEPVHKVPGDRGWTEGGPENNFRVPVWTVDTIPGRA